MVKNTKMPAKPAIPRAKTSESKPHPEEHAKKSQEQLEAH
jgi:hypothetical protein